jgi:hypothetical protein
MSAYEVGTVQYSTYEWCHCFNMKCGCGFLVPGQGDSERHGGGGGGGEKWMLELNAVASKVGWTFWHRFRITSTKWGQWGRLIKLKHTYLVDVLVTLLL